MHNSQIFFLDTIYIHIHQIIKDKSDNNQLPSPGYHESITPGIARNGPSHPRQNFHSGIPV